MSLQSLASNRRKIIYVQTNLHFTISGMRNK